MIASDLHGSAYYCKELLRAYRAEQPDKLLLLGDLLYHGPRNDLPLEYAPKEVIELLNGSFKNILCVRGNCEAEVDQMVLAFPILADYMLLLEKGRTLFITHGHHHNTQTPPPLGRGDILIHGHTHVLTVTPFGNDNLYINPGSVTLPKENNPKSYMIYEDGLFTIKDMNKNTLLEVRI
jgi:putative phosphoesterase